MIAGAGTVRQRASFMSQDPLPTPMAKASQGVSCVGCGRHYATEAWRALPAVSTLSGADVGRHLLDWPAGWHVEVRACACGRTMGRTVRGE